MGRQNRSYIVKQQYECHCYHCDFVAYSNTEKEEVTKLRLHYKQSHPTLNVTQLRTKEYKQSTYHASKPNQLVHETSQTNY